MTAQLSTHTDTTCSHFPRTSRAAQPYMLRRTSTAYNSPQPCLHACTHAEESSRTTAASTRFMHSKRYKQCAITHACSVSPCQWQLLIQHPANTSHVCLSLCVNAPPSAAPNPTCTRPHTPPPFRAAPLAQHSTALANQPATPHRASRVLRPSSSSSSLATSGALCPAAMGATTPPSPYAPYCA